MSETVRVQLREATLSESARLSERGDQLFLAMDNPPPVRSLLEVLVGEDKRALEVARVVEVVEESETARGCYGRWVELERLAVLDRVGSEHLEPGISSGGAGVPAPVVMMNTSELMLNDGGDDDDLVLTRSERFAVPSEPTSVSGGEVEAAEPSSEAEVAADEDAGRGEAEEPSETPSETEALTE